MVVQSSTNWKLFGHAEVIVLTKKRLIPAANLRGSANRRNTGAEENALFQQAPPPLNTAQGVARRIFTSSQIDQVWQ